jgi:hypothetical protein
MKAYHCYLLKQLGNRLLLDAAGQQHPRWDTRQYYPLVGWRWNMQFETEQALKSYYKRAILPQPINILCDW